MTVCLLYRFIMNYQDHLTKFCVLRPLPSKRACVIASHLVDIFTTFGAPRILQSDNGREFVACIIEEVKVMWPDLVIVHGKPRHPQSQGSIERANGDVEDMIRSWLNDKQTTNWATGLKFVQLQKNTAVNRILGTSPYKALFGQDPSVGLCTDFPRDVLDALRPESEDLLRLCTSAGPGRTDGDPEHVPIVNANIPADGDGGGGRQHDDSITAHDVGASEELADENAVLGTIPDDATALIDNDDSEENINDAFPETALSIIVGIGKWRTSR